MVEALPSVEAWRDRPVAQVLAVPKRDQASSRPVVYSSIFGDPWSGRDSLLIGVISAEDKWVGAVSLARLGLTEAVTQARAVETEPEEGLRRYNVAPTGAIAFLVDAEGRVIHHPDPTLVGQSLQKHAGVQAVIQGWARATYHTRFLSRMTVVISTLY